MRASPASSSVCGSFPCECLVKQPVATTRSGFETSHVMSTRFLGALLELEFQQNWQQGWGSSADPKNPAEIDWLLISEAWQPWRPMCGTALSLFTKSPWPRTRSRWRWQQPPGRTSRKLEKKVNKLSVGVESPISWPKKHLKKPGKATAGDDNVVSSFLRCLYNHPSYPRKSRPGHQWSVEFSTIQFS